MSELADALIAAGWLASPGDASDSLDALAVGADLLPWLAECARSSEDAVTPRGANTSETGKSARPTLAPVLNCVIKRGAKLTTGWPGCEERPLSKWIGRRLLWWPNGVPEGRKVAWGSSRMGRAIDERPDWFAVLRSATAKLDPARDILLTAPSTTVDRFLERAAILFGLRRLRVHLEERRSLVDWLTRLRRQLWRACREQRQDVEGAPSDVFISPLISLPSPLRGEGPGVRGSNGVTNPSPLTPIPSPQGGEGEKNKNGIGAVPLSDLPLRDRVLISAADQVIALQVRPSGNLHQLLQARLNDPSWPMASVWLALGESLVAAEVATELQSLGAVGWWLIAANAASDVQLKPTARVADVASAGCDVLNDLPWPDESYFVHWTRRRDGPWPEQSENDFLDDLLWSNESANHSAFAALSRILQERRLIASSLGIRGGTPVLSFSANSLKDIAKQRTFRVHQGRWDGESYGLCIRRDWLQARGIQPVIYGDDALWPTLVETDRPFFQLQRTRSRRGAKVIDWSQEAEWRVLGDVDLSDASRNEVLLFVPTEDEARQLSAISPWPVLILPSSPLAPSGERGRG